MFRLTSVLLAALATSALASPFKQAQSANNEKAAMMGNLMKNAVPTKNSQMRRLDEDEEYAVDLSGYSVKFMKCQFVKQFDDEIAEEEELDTVLGTKRFVIFRLCAEGSCSSCNVGYGEYVVPMDEYLEAVVDYRQEEQEEYCNTCEEVCEAEEEANEADADENAEDGERKLKRKSSRKLKNRFSRKLSDDCATCSDICEKIENMEDNNYIDATEFMNCQQIYDGGDDDGADENVLFAGPMCASSGAKIKIGVFSDEDCMFLDESKDVEDYLADGDGVQMKLSHALLKKTYDEDCISCLVPEEEDEDGNNNNDDDKEPEVQEICENLYEASGKCEKKHGFDNGYADYAEYANQATNEEIVCDFISSIKSGTYSQTGEIVVGGSNRYAEGGKTTGGQKFALTFFILGTVGLAVYAAMLHTNLTKESKADLSAQGGAMA